MLTTLLLLFNGFFVTTASAEAGPDLRSTVTVPDGTYLVGDELTVTLTVTNVGDSGAYYIRKAEQHVSGTSFYITDDSGWGDLGPDGLGANYLPGESREYRLTGVLGDWAGEARFRLGVISPTDVNPADDLGDGVVPVVSPQTEVEVSGQVFGDADQDGAPSPGEALAGVTMSMHRDIGQQDVLTDADGRFSFPDLTVGAYYLSSENAPDGWVLPGGWQELRLDGSVANTDVPLRALRPLSESLRAEFTLDEQTYQAGDEAQVTVTLANTGTRPITGIHAACDRAGNGRDLDITEAGWGELAYSGPGATIQPGQTRSFLVPATVRPITGNWGFLVQACDFSQSDEYLEGAPQDVHAAKVIGMDGTSTGTIFHDANDNGSIDAGEGLADQAVRLTDIDSGHEFTTQTDANGVAALAGPAGRYRMTILGPWTFTDTHVVFNVVGPPLEWDNWVRSVRPS